jgi:hypothetical protein
MNELFAAFEVRLKRLETIVGQHPFLVDEKAYLDRTETAQFLEKSVSTVIRRRKHDERFPKPDFVDGQYLWKFSALRACKREGQFQKL